MFYIKDMKIEDNYIHHCQFITVESRSGKRNTIKGPWRYMFSIPENFNGSIICSNSYDEIEQHKNKAEKELNIPLTIIED